MSRVVPVDSFMQEEMAIYQELNENQLYHFYEPDRGIFIAESLNVIERALQMDCEIESFLVEPKFIPQAEKLYETYLLRKGLSLDRMKDLLIYTAEQKLMSTLVGYHVSRGVLAAMRRPLLKTAAELLQDPSFHRIAVLEAVQNPTNIGAVIRSAAALGIDAVLLTEGCSDPLYRRASRVSMGTVFQVPWAYLSRTESDNLTRTMHQFGFKTAAMALTEDSLPINDKKVGGEDKLAIVLGTESDGLKERTIAQCDYTVKIPMYHGVDSLNVAAASAVAFWELRR